MSGWQIPVKRHILDIEKHSHRQVLARRAFNRIIAGGANNEKGKWMAKAFDVAQGCSVKFAAILVDRNGVQIAVGKNQSHSRKILHAEMDALLQVDPTEKNLVMYCTAEPCPMCMSAIVWSGQVDHVVYGTDIPFLIDNGHPQIDIRASQVVHRWRNTKRVTLEQHKADLTNILYQRPKKK